MAGRGLQKMRKEAQSVRYNWVLFSIQKKETGKKKRKKNELAFSELGLKEVDRPRHTAWQLPLRAFRRHQGLWEGDVQNFIKWKSILLP